MLEKIILFLILLILGIFSKNDTIVIAIVFLIACVLLKIDNIKLNLIKEFCIKYGIVLITIYAFVPIAKGDITINEVIKAIFTWRAWVAIISGILVTYFAKYGIEIMNTDPDIITFVLVGIIMGIIVFKGVASGPLIGSGIALMLFSIIEFFIQIFKT